MRLPLLALTLAPALTAGQATGGTAIPALVRAFADHPVVAIAESHWLRQAGAFYIALTRDSDFQNTVTDVVVEFASGQSQDLLDRYVVGGESLPPDTLRSIWRNTTKTASWESPIYARWLAVLRDVNRSRTPARRIRVLAGDTPVEWSQLHTPAEWTALGDNNISLARVITDQVLARKRRALVVLGSNHLTRGGGRDGSPNTTSRVDARAPGAMYVVWLYTGRPGGDSTDARMEREGWKAPRLVPLPSNWTGGLRAGTRRLDQVADALLFLGPGSSLVTEEPEPGNFDSTYRRELARRSWIEWGDSNRVRQLLPDPPAPAIPRGQVESHSITEPATGRERRVWVYTPAGYSANAARPYDLLVAFDGGVYLDDIPLPAILDTLIASRAVPPTVALLIDNASGAERLNDLANRAQFATLLSDVFIPWVRQRWAVTRDPRRTTVTGSSAGGLAAAYVALKRPDIFGRVLSQSGAFWRGNEASNDAPYEWLTQAFAATPKREIRFFMDVGATESGGAMGGAAPSILEANRHLRAALEAKGYEVIYTEVAGGGHAPEFWRLRLPIGLRTLAAVP